MTATLFDKYSELVENLDPIKYTGQVLRVKGLLIESLGPQAVVGEVCQILVPRGRGVVWAEVVGFSGHTMQLMSYTDTEGIEAGSPVIATGDFLQIPVSDKLLGRVLDSMGKPIDDSGDIGSCEYYSIYNPSPHVLTRKPITEQVATGVRAIDGLLPIGKGQRMGIFSGSGVGKSTLLGMIARNTSADVNVIALIGERGREVREFMEHDLGEEGRKRSVVVVSSSNSPPLSRLRGAYVATAIAEYFRDQGKDVMLLLDSITRFARAQREIGLAIGEPPAQRGYTPSVFDLMPKILERCGTSERGTITGFYTILVEGDDMDEPIADTARGILDGHVVLSRKLASRYHYPAIDVLQSISRLETKVATPQMRRAAGVVRKNLAVYDEAEDLVNVGAYVKGTNPEIDEAIAKRPGILSYLRQGIEERFSIEDTVAGLQEIAGVDE